MSSIPESLGKQLLIEKRTLDIGEHRQSGLQCRNLKRVEHLLVEKKALNIDCQQLTTTGQFISTASARRVQYDVHSS